MTAEKYGRASGGALANKLQIFKLPKDKQRHHKHKTNLRIKEDKFD